VNASVPKPSQFRAKASILPKEARRIGWLGLSIGLSAIIKITITMYVETERRATANIRLAAITLGIKKGNNMMEEPKVATVLPNSLGPIE